MLYMPVVVRVFLLTYSLTLQERFKSNVYEKRSFLQAHLVLGKQVSVFPNFKKVCFALSSATRNCTSRKVSWCFLTVVDCLFCNSRKCLETLPKRL